VSAATRLVARNFAQRGGQLYVDGVGVEDLAAHHGTPMFAYSTSVVRGRWSQLRDTLPGRYEIFYSVKANPNPAILGLFLERGAGLEVASAGEYWQARSAGCEAHRIVFAGPGKTEEELDFILKRGIGEIHVESAREGERIVGLARRYGIRPCVAIRINPGTVALGGALRMGGKASPFGVDEEAAEGLVAELARSGAVEVTGIHLFSGTQILDHEVLLRQYRKGLEIARSISERLRRPLHTLDLGGGLGIPYFEHEQELDLAALGGGLRGLEEDLRGDRAFEGTRFVLEPGRFLIGEAGIYLARVTDVKVSRGKKFVIVDGGMHHHLAASGNLGQVIKRNFPSALVNKLNASPVETVDVVGPLCTPLDTLARDVDLPTPEPGDLFGIFQSGAYALTASPLGFLSRPTPPEVLVEAGVDRVVRRRATLEEPEAGHDWSYRPW
jgi:diaminopimelate decarboxylase